MMPEEDEINDSRKPAEARERDHGERGAMEIGAYDANDGWSKVTAKIAD